MIVDQRTGKNGGPALEPSGLPKLSFRYSAVLHFFVPILKIKKEKKLSNNGG
jgi:hypothetical protein